MIDSMNKSLIFFSYTKEISSFSASFQISLHCCGVLVPLSLGKAVLINGTES